MDLIVAAIPTGTTASLAVTYSNSIFAGGQTIGYAVDSATLTSQVPTISGATSTPAVTSITSTFNVTQSGSAVISSASAWGGTNFTLAFTTPNTLNFTRDAQTGYSIGGHRNNVAVITGAQSSAQWTTSGYGFMFQAIFR
jgi:hypothetical protein